MIWAALDEKEQKLLDEDKDDCLSERLAHMIAAGYSILTRMENLYLWTYFFPQFLFKFFILILFLFQIL